MEIIRKGTGKIGMDLEPAPTACFAAAVGSLTRSSVSPPSASTTTPPSATAAWGSVLPGPITLYNFTILPLFGRRLILSVVAGERGSEARSELAERRKMFSVEHFRCRNAWSRESYPVSRCAIRIHGCRRLFLITHFCVTHLCVMKKINLYSGSSFLNSFICLSSSSSPEQHSVK